MRNGEWNSLVSVAGRILLILLFVFSQSAWAGQDQKTKDKVDSAPKTAAPQVRAKQTSVTAARAQGEDPQSAAEARNGEEESIQAEEKPSGDSSREGIKVHGHWTIDVRNPDGTLVTHREFENSLVQAGSSGGGKYLSHLLSCGALGTCTVVLVRNPGQELRHPVSHRRRPSLRRASSASSLIINHIFQVPL